MNTKHKADCKMSFGRKDSSCPRCVELLNGSAPRASFWSNVAFKKQQEANHLASIRSHNCQASGCAVVCTFGDY